MIYIYLIKSKTLIPPAEYFFERYIKNWSLKFTKIHLLTSFKAFLLCNSGLQAKANYFVYNPTESVCSPPIIKLSALGKPFVY